MKKIIIICLTLVASVSMAQQKLPKTLTITLTDKQVLRLDSAINFGASVMDSKSQTNWFNVGFKPVYDQINKQLVKDTIKTKKP